MEQRFELRRAEPDVRPLRAGDQDRHEAVLALSDEYAAGRLDHAEFERRQGLALEATFVHDLDPLFADLPARTAPGTSRAAALPPYVRTGGMPPWAQGRRRRGGGVPFVVALLAVLVAIGFASGTHAFWLVLPVLWFVLAARHRRRWAMAYAATRPEVRPR